MVYCLFDKEKLEFDEDPYRGGAIYRCPKCGTKYLHDEESDQWSTLRDEE